MHFHYIVRCTRDVIEVTGPGLGNPPDPWAMVSADKDLMSVLFRGSPDLRFLGLVYRPSRNRVASRSGNPAFTIRCCADSTS